MKYLDPTSTLQYLGSDIPIHFVMGFYGLAVYYFCNKI